MNPGHWRPSPALKTTRSVVVDLAAAERAKDFRVWVDKHASESMQND